MVEALFTDSTRLLDLLVDDLSLHSFANNQLRKALLLSAASQFEVRISRALERFADVHSQGHEALSAMIRQQVIARKFHTHFKWDSRTSGAGPFFGLFGERWRDYLKQKVSSSPTLKEGVESFIELGQLRNELVHQNFATYTFEKTVEDVHELYSKANTFVEFIETELANESFGRPAT